MTHRISDAEALRRHTDQSGGAAACWPWTGSRSGPGYGYIGTGGRTRRAHRVAWEQTNGPIPDGMFVCHHCDNPPCVNPAHLFVGTPADNLADMMAKQRDRRPVGADHPNARLTDEMVREIRELRQAGWTYKSLSARFAISKASCHNVLTYKTYKSYATAQAT